MTRLELFRGGACRRSAEFVRLRRGVHVRAAEWRSASVDVRHRACIEAVAATWTSPVLLRESAAAVWGLPLVEPLDGTVHVAASPSVGSRTRNGVAEHRGSASGRAVVVDGLAVSDLAQTVLDLCRFSSFRRAVTAADHALRMRDRRGERLLEAQELRDRVAELPAGTRGRAAAARAAAFADERADSPLESISRVAMHEAGLPAPVLQRVFHDEEGLIGAVDFFFEDADVIGEADGAHKYTDPRFLRGRTPEQALLEEKRREERLRALVSSVVRWRWQDAYSAHPLIARLAHAGVRPTEASASGRGVHLLQDASTVRGRLAPGREGGGTEGQLGW